MLDRRLLFGPHPGHGDPVLLASEPTTPKASQDRILLNPLCFYGRQRQYQYSGGEMTFHGYLVAERTDGLLPAGPAEPEAGRRRGAAGGAVRRRVGGPRQASERSRPRGRLLSSVMRWSRHSDLNRGPAVARPNSGRTSACYGMVGTISDVRYVL